MCNNCLLIVFGGGRGKRVERWRGRVESSHEEVEPRNAARSEIPEEHKIDTGRNKGRKNSRDTKEEEGLCLKGARHSAEGGAQKVKSGVGYGRLKLIVEEEFTGRFYPRR